MHSLGLKWIHCKRFTVCILTERSIINNIVLVYSSVTLETLNSKECAGHCLIDQINCNAFYFNDSTKDCLLGNLGHIFKVENETEDSIGFVDTGKVT